MYQPFSSYSDINSSAWTEREEEMNEESKRQKDQEIWENERAYIVREFIQNVVLGCKPDDKMRTNPYKLWICVQETIVSCEM